MIYRKKLVFKTLTIHFFQASIHTTFRYKNNWNFQYSKTVNGPKII